MRDADRAVDVGVIDGVDLGGRRLRGVDRVAGRTGIVDQDVQPISVRGDQVRGGRDGLLGGDVERNQDDVDTVGGQLLCGHAAARLVPGAEEHLPPQLAETAGGLEAQALVRAGDQDCGLLRVGHAHKTPDTIRA